MEITKLSHFWTIYYNSNDLALADYPNLSPRSDLEPNYLDELQTIGSKVYHTKISHRLFILKPSDMHKVEVAKTPKMLVI